jgi:hypothetical protein
MDRAFFAVFLASAPLVWRYCDKTLLVFYLVIGLQPMFGSFGSYTRFLLLAFPLYIAYGQLIRSDRYLLPLVYAGLLLQALLLSLHASHHWVA